MKYGHATAALVGALAIASFVGCADPEERSMCTAFDRFQDAADSLQDVSLDGATAGEAADAVENVLGEVRNLDAVADTRYSTQIDQVESALDDLLRVLDSIEEDADTATWEPLVEESAEDARHAASVVTELIVPVCPAQT